LWLRIEAFFDVTLLLLASGSRRFECSWCLLLQAQAVQGKDRLSIVHGRRESITQRRNVMSQRTWILRVYLHVRCLNNFVAFHSEVAIYQVVLYQRNIIENNNIIFPAIFETFKATWVHLLPPDIKIKILHSACRLYIHIWCVCQNKQQLFLCTAWTDWKWDIVCWLRGTSNSLNKLQVKFSLLNVNICTKFMSKFDFSFTEWNFDSPTQKC
jgi:hypothetical protein